MKKVEIQQYKEAILSGETIRIYASQIEKLGGPSEAIIYQKTIEISKQNIVPIEGCLPSGCVGLDTLHKHLPSIPPHSIIAIWGHLSEIGLMKIHRMGESKAKSPTFYAEIMPVKSHKPLGRVLLVFPELLMKLEPILAILIQEIHLNNLRKSLWDAPNSVSAFDFQSKLFPFSSIPEIGGGLMSLVQRDLIDSIRYPDKSLAFRVNYENLAELIEEPAMDSDDTAMVQSLGLHSSTGSPIQKPQI